MSGSVLEARAIIRGEDRTKAAFDSIKARLTGLVQHVAAVDRLMSSVGKMSTQVGGFASANSTAGELSKLVAVTKSMGTASKETERSSLSLTDALKREMEAVKLAHAALSAAGAPTGQLAAEQRRLGGIINTTTAAIERQAAAEQVSIGVSRRAFEIASKTAREEQRVAERRHEQMRHRGVLGHALAGAAGAVAAGSILGVAEKGVEAGAERQHVMVGMQNAGMSGEEIDRAHGLAVQIAKTTPNMNVSQLLDLHKEARSAVQGPEEAFAIMPDLARAASILKGMGVEDAHVSDIVKGGETLGLMNDPKRFHRYLEGQVKAMNVMGKTITTEQIYEAAKYSQSAGASLSDDFLNLTMPSMIQELHGSSAGVALAGLTKRFRGGLAHQHLAVEMLDKQGMLEEPDKIVRNKAGQIMGYKGKLRGDDLLASDPDRFFREVWKPHAIGMGFKTLEDQERLLAMELPPVASNAGRIFLQQEQTFANHRKNYEAAPGLTQASENQRADPKVEFHDLTNALNDLAAAATTPMMGNAAKALSSLAGVVREISDAAGNHPALAGTAAVGAGAAALGGAGWMSVQMATGFGLVPAAGHLETAAIALETAAGRIGAAGAVGAVEGAGGAAAAARIGGVIGAGLLAGTSIAAGVAVMGSGIYVLSHDGLTAPGHGRAEPPSKVKGGPGHWAKGRGAMVWVPGAPPALPAAAAGDEGGDFTFGSDVPTGFRRTAPTRMPVGGLSGDFKVSLDPNSKVEAVIVVKAEPSPELLRIAASVQSIRSAGNIAASVAAGATGLSTPTKPFSYKGGNGLGHM